MALQFNPYPLEPWIQKQQNEQKDYSQIPSQLIQGLGIWQQAKEAQRQDALKKLMMDQDQQRWEVETYGSGGIPQPQSFPSDAPLARSMGATPGMSMVSDFQSGRWKGGNKMLPSFSGIDQMQPRKTLRERQMELDQQKLTADKNLTLDDLLYKKVANGELSLQDAYKMKQQYSSSGGMMKPPSGFRFTPDGNLEAIPGGPSSIKTELDKQKMQAAVDTQKRDAQNVISKIDEALGKVGPTTAGFGSLLKNVPSTGAMNLSADLDTITSQLGLGKLMEMKNQSKAGASGMGQLSDREMTLLVSALTSLKQAQSPEQLKKNLEAVKTHYQNWLSMEEGINPYQNGGQSAPSQAGVITATNPQTGEKIKSVDGGKTWQPM